MLILIAIFISILIPLIIVAVQTLRPRIGYLWLVAVGGTLVTWALILVSRLQIPQEIPLLIWKPEVFFPVSPALLLDNYSWPYAVAVATLPLSVFLTDVARVEEIQARAWASSLFMTGAGLLAVLAANPLTLVLAWVVIALAEVLILLRRVGSSTQRERVIISFSVRATGIFLLIFAILRGRLMGLDLTFTDIPLEISGYLLLAAGLRLGVLPPHQPFMPEPTLRRGLGTVVRLIPVAASMSLLTRTATVGVPDTWKSPLLIGAGFASITASVAWISARDELDGRPFWILGLTSLSLVGAVIAQPEASLAWGLSALFSGSLLFLTSARDKRYIILLALGLLCISGLPLTPAWSGAQIYGRIGSVPIGYKIIFLFTQTALIIGYIRHAIRIDESTDGLERWVRVVYPAGLALLPFTFAGVVFIQELTGRIIVDGWWGSIVVLALVVLAMFSRRWVPTVPPRVMNVLRIGFSLDWLYRLFWQVYRLSARLVSGFTLILEGEGGVLWAVLILVLLLTFLVTSNGGG